MQSESFCWRSTASYEKPSSGFAIIKDITVVGAIGRGITNVVAPRTKRSQPDLGACPGKPQKTDSHRVLLNFRVRDRLAAVEVCRTGPAGLTAFVFPGSKTIRWRLLGPSSGTFVVLSINAPEYLILKMD